MIFRKKVLIAALALTLTSTNSITKDIPLLNKANISFAAEEASTESAQVNNEPTTTNETEKDNSTDTTGSSNVLLTTDLTYEYTPDHVIGVVEVLKDEFKVLLDNYNKDEFKKLYKEDPNKVLENLEVYNETFKSLLALEDQNKKDDQNKTEEEKNKEKAERYKDALINLILIEEDLEADKAKIEKELEILKENQNKEEKEVKETVLTNIKEKLTSILGTLEGVEYEPKVSENNTKVLVITITKGEDHKKYLDEKEELKKEITTLIKNINDNIGLFKEEDKDQVKLELKVAKELLEDPSATKDELIDYRDKLKERFKITEKSSLEEVKHKLSTIKEKLENKDSEKYISKKYHDESIKKLGEIEKEIPNANKEALDQYLQELTLMDQKIEKIKEVVTGSDLSRLIKKIDDANSNKVAQAYNRASKPKKDAYDKAITDAETYLDSVLEKVSYSPDTFDSTSYKEKIDEKIKKIEDADKELDGLNYDGLLKKAKEKLDANKKSLSEESFKELQKQYDLLNDPKNTSYTVEDVNSFSKLIDEKVEKDKKKISTTKSDGSTDPSSKKGDVKVKKVEVPRAEDKGKKSAKSIVRTGIDSVKIFAIVAVVAIVLLLVTKRKKDNK